MNIKTKIIASTAAVVTAAVVTVTVVSITGLMRKSETDITQYRQDMLEKYKRTLKDLVEVAASEIDAVYQQGIKNGGNDAAVTAVKKAVSVFRYDSGGNYFWINDTARPYPRMVMHPITPALNGILMDDPKYNCAFGSNINFFTVMVDMCERQGEGFVIYDWPRPGTTKAVPKLSYVRAYKPLNWIVGTGVYIDDIDTAVAAKKVQMAAELFSTAATIIIAALLLLAIAAVVAYMLAQRITLPLKAGVSIANSIAAGDLSVKIDERYMKMKDETGELTGALKRMTESLLLKADILKRIAAGDLTVQVPVVSDRDTLGESMQKMKGELTHTVERIKNTAAEVATGSGRLNSSSMEMSQGASEQAGNVESVSAAVEEVSSSTEEVSSSIEQVSASVEEVSASIEEMTATIRQNSDNAHQTEKIAVKSAADARESGSAVELTVKAMKEIAGKVSIIQEIARQTNLLSLNASIEAARAGEHGKGFAVVASEVQKLADRSQRAASEIGELSKTNVDVAERAGVMLAKLVPDIQKTAELVAEINAACSEQNNGAQQVNNAIQQISGAVQQVSSAVQQVAASTQSVNQSVQQIAHVAQQNAAGSEEVASTAEELSAQASQLQDAISSFKIENSAPAREVSQKAIPIQKAARIPSPVFIPKPDPGNGNGNGKMHVENLNEPVLMHPLGGIASSTNKKKGIVIDMKNSGDEDDNAFKKF
ncbi:MAG: methyl-accepting chemotaxis protein [Spirochaetes bacterium]|nr:methyl-accepting chemotaxis protein [Spirochaetota bacterium]